MYVNIWWEEVKNTVRFFSVTGQETHIEICSIPLANTFPRDAVVTPPLQIFKTWTWPWATLSSWPHYELGCWTRQTLNLPTSAFLWFCGYVGIQILTAELKGAANLREKGEDKLWVPVIFEPNTAVARTPCPKVAPRSSLKSEPHTVLWDQPR